MIGDDTRPPCVVHMPNSSASERSQSSLPSPRQRHQQAVAAEGKDVAGRGIDDRRGPGNPVRRHVAREDVVVVFPEQLAGVGVEAHEPLLHALRRRPTCSAGRGDRRRRRARNAARTGPSTRGLSPARRPRGGRPGLGRDAGAGGAAPLGPAVAAHEPGRRAPLGGSRAREHRGSRGNRIWEPQNISRRRRFVPQPAVVVRLVGGFVPARTSIPSCLAIIATFTYAARSHFRFIWSSSNRTGRGDLECAVVVRCRSRPG